MTSTRSASGISRYTAQAQHRAARTKRDQAKLTYRYPCGGISVNPGDIILADPDGVIVIPRKDAPQILEDAKKFQAADESKLAAAKNGTAKREWVEKTLAAKEFEIIDDVYERNPDHILTVRHARSWSKKPLWIYLQRRLTKSGMEIELLLPGRSNVRGEFSIHSFHNEDLYTLCLLYPKPYFAKSRQGQEAQPVPDLLFAFFTQVSENTRLNVKGQS